MLVRAMSVSEATFTHDELTNGLPDMRVRIIAGQLCVLVESIAPSQMMAIEASSDGISWSQIRRYQEVPTVSEVAIPLDRRLPLKLLRVRVQTSIKKSGG